MLLDELARLVRTIHYDRCPAEALSTARLGIMDTIGVTLAGAADDITATFVRALAPTFAPGPALLVGDTRRVDVLSAALVNGTASHALDFDDCSNTLGGHPSTPIVPGLWALAEQRKADGKSFLTAYVAGFEAESRLGRAVNFHHYEKGWHPTATLGVFGAAAACGHMMGLSEDKLAIALSLAATMASGIKANFGTMAKPFHVGHASRNGSMAAMMAAEGFTANASALEHGQGFLDVFNGAGNYDASRLTTDWANPLDLVEPGIAFKRHPCCASTHPAVDALLSLRAAHGLQPGNVQRIESWTHPRRFKHTNRPDPNSGLDGKFSVQYVLARALAEGIVSIGHFSDDAVRDPAMRTVMSKVTSVADPNARTDSTDHFYARVRVTTNDGRQLESFVEAPLGRDKDHPLPQGTLEAKFLDCASQKLERAAASSLMDRLLSLESVADMNSLSEAMAAGLAAPKAPRTAA